MGQGDRVSDSPTDQFTGTCGFRLMPADDLADAASTFSRTPIGAAQMLLRYTWIHPADGPQQGTLLLGGPEDGGREVHAAWADTWHQQPGLLVLTGTRDGDRVDLAATYLGDWGWEISFTGVMSDSPAMTMRNVVPASARDSLPPDSPPVTAGPYDVMLARWFSPAAP